MIEINPAVINWFERRGIDAETVVRFGIYSGLRRGTGDEARILPDPRGNIIAFPFIDRGEVVGEKYRTADKRFWQRKDGRRVFFNADVLDDPALVSGDAALVITEGEMDCLSVITAGNPFAVSVPDGAPPARDQHGNLIEVPEGADDIDPQHDEKFSFIAAAWPRLQAIKRIIIAVDNDEPGQRLAAELVRRLGRPRCSFVSYPTGCKDLNDVLVNHGYAAVNRCLHGAKPYPVSGLYRPTEFPEEPELCPVSTGWPELDEHLLPYFPALMVVSGFAGQGKSSWVIQLVTQLALLHEWPCAIANFEMQAKHVLGLIRCTYLDRRQVTIYDADRWADEHFTFIAPDPQGDEDTNLAWLIEKAEAAVIRNGARVLVIDPWNELDHNRRRDETLTEYTGRALRELKRFARNFHCLVIVVAHPAKCALAKDPDEITLYDISDSAHWANKADLGVMITRREFDSLVSVAKVRYQPDTGSPGAVSMRFDARHRLFRVTGGQP